MSILSDWPWEPDPDYTRLVATLRREGDPGHVPFLELGADQEIVDTVLGERPFRAEDYKGEREGLKERLDRKIRFYYGLGYDAVLERPIVHIPEPERDTSKLVADDTAGLSRGKRSWAEEGSGRITSWADFEQYPWPEPGEADFFALDYMADHLPEGMGIIASPFGALQPVMLLMGYEALSFALYDQRDLVQAIFDKVCALRVAMAEALVERDRVIALWLLDDMGFKTSTMISPADLREFVFPIHRAVAQVAHDAGMPILLHACGNVEPVMEDLIEDVGFDAKHSFEDAIMPVETFVERFGDRISAVGGLDVDLLARGTEAQVRGRTRHVLRTCAPSRGYVLGTGNTVANYIPVDNFLAMLDEGWRFNNGVA